MTTDLVVLVAVGIFSMALAFTPNSSRVTRGGMAWGLGNRETAPQGDPEWVGRAERAHRNLMENLPLFIILVLVGHLAQKADALTANACVAFLAARVAHALVYIGGITILRTLVFYVGVAAEAVIAWRILS